MQFGELVHTRRVAVQREEIVNLEMDEGYRHTIERMVNAFEW